MCKRGMRGGFGKAIVRAVIRKMRRETKEQLKRGYAPDHVVSVPYTD